MYLLTLSIVLHIHVFSMNQYLFKILGPRICRITCVRLPILGPCIYLITCLRLPILGPCIYLITCLRLPILGPRICLITCLRLPILGPPRICLAARDFEAYNIIDSKTTLGRRSTSYTGQVTVVIHQMCPPVVVDISISQGE